MSVISRKPKTCKNWSPKFKKSKNNGMRKESSTVKIDSKKKREMKIKTTIIKQNNLTFLPTQMMSSILNSKILKSSLVNKLSIGNLSMDSKINTWLTQSEMKPTKMVTHKYQKIISYFWLQTKLTIKTWIMNKKIIPKFKLGSPHSKSTDFLSFSLLKRKKAFPTQVLMDCHRRCQKIRKSK